MEETSRDDIRRLLKTFGVGADEAIIRHLERVQHPGPLHLKFVLEDLTDYGRQSAERLHFEVKGEVRR
ncbi:MAG TPA: hypothetical protein VFI11_10590 [Anaerolineales bacterium]|nr:hypothetical protein [Anaerolineales bacterium]